MNRSEAEKLIPQYFRGELSAREREELVRAVLEDQDLYNAFAEQQVPSELLDDTEVRARIDRTLRPSVSQSRRLVRALVDLQPKWRFALVAFVLVCVASSLLVIRRFGATSTPIPPIALTLTPLERGSGSAEILRVPPGNHVVVLTALVNGEFSGTYSAVIDGPGRGEIDFKGLRPDSGPPGFRSVAIHIPSNRLTPGNYTLTLYASDDGSRSNPVAGYIFSVVPASR